MRISLSTSLLPLVLLIISLQLGLQQVAAVDLSPDQRDALINQKAEADALFAKGDYGAASRSYSKAIDLDPTSWNLRYRRATAYISLGKHSPAVEDLDAIIRLNPKFSQARLQKAKILAKEGSFTEAKGEVKKYLKESEKIDETAIELETNLKIAEAALSAAHKAHDKSQWQACVDSATKALEVGPNSLELRRIRLDCSEALGDVDAVIGDLSRLTHLVPSNPVFSLRLAYISYFIHASPNALQDLKQCLHYDPDSKLCKKAHKTLRSLDKDTAKARNFVDSSTWRSAIKILVGGGEDVGLIKRFEDAMDQAIKDGYLPISLAPKHNSQSRLALYKLACKSQVGTGSVQGIKKYCEAVLSMKGGEDDIDALVGKGDVAMKEESWEEAVRMLAEAFEKSGRSSQEVLGKLQKAQRLLKQSKAKDYYKVIGVPRDADERTIKKAYRTAAKIAHPDVGGSEEKMAALNEAYEVLSKKELRARYDQGDDPNDPTGGQSQQNPFAHHGGGGGGNFQHFFQQGGFSGGGGGGGFSGQQYMFQQAGNNQRGEKMHFQWGG